MKWTETKDGWVSDDGYTIKDCELFLPNDTSTPVTRATNRHFLKTIAEAHLMAVSILGVDDRNMRIDVAKEAARNFLTMYSSKG